MDKNEKRYTSLFEKLSGLELEDVHSSKANAYLYLMRLGVTLLLYAICFFSPRTFFLRDRLCWVQCFGMGRPLVHLRMGGHALVDYSYVDSWDYFFEEAQVGLFRL